MYVVCRGYAFQRLSVVATWLPLVICPGIEMYVPSDCLETKNGATYIPCCMG